MRMFISWSGERSKAIAEVLREWLPSVLQAVRPYFSPDDVTKGSRWSSEIAKELEASRIALLIVTPENQAAPWLLFEAGALSKNLDKSKVCPLLFGGLEPSDVKGPLVQFQAAKFSKDEMKRVMKMVNSELTEIALAPDVFEKVFEMWWPKLNEGIEEALSKSDSAKGEKRRSERDILEEILLLSRRNTLERRIETEYHPAWDDVVEGTLRLFRATVMEKAGLPDPEIVDISRRIVRALRHLSKTYGPNKRTERITTELSFYLKQYESYLHSKTMDTNNQSPDNAE